MTPSAVDAQIGVFDSGIGGLSVVRALHKALPGEAIIYLGDTARVPYGDKSEQAVKQYSLECAQFLVAQEVKLIVVACNTASAVALKDLQRRLSLPVIGVVEGGAVAAARATKNRRVGVIGTKATIRSGAYRRAIQQCDPSIQVVQVPTPLLVHLVEEGWIDRPITCSILREYLRPLQDADIDTIVLGCTHYPYLREAIHALTDGTIIIDSAEETARSVASLLEAKALYSTACEPAAVRVHVTDVQAETAAMAQRMLGANVALVWSNVDGHTPA